MITERLIIRPFTKEDLQAFFIIYSSSDINRFLPWYPLKDMEESETWFEKHCDPQKNRQYAICMKEDNIPIGYVNLSCKEPYDLGYAILKPYQNKGYVTEAANALIAVLKEEGQPYITATHDALNPASGRIMQKLGMQYCYTYEENWMPKDFLVNFRMYQMNLNGEHPVYEHYRNVTSHWMIEPELFLNTQIEETAAWYKEDTEQCECDYCTAFRKSFSHCYPATAKLLSFYGIDVNKPLDTSPAEPEGNTITYDAVQYVLKGVCNTNKDYSVEGLTIHKADAYPTYKQAENTFVIGINGIRLPWEN